MFMLSELPGLPRRNSLTNTHVTVERYTLPFAWEECVSRILAFLSSITGKGAHVAAVCIKENRQAQMDVLPAINKGKPDDGESVLEEVKKNFLGLFNTLSHHGTPHKSRSASNRY